MIVTKQPVLRRFWYPVLPLAQLEDGKPKPFTLLGENIVLWKKADGTVACLKDRCCHRTAKLSLGFLDADNIVCGYHGWTFSGSGACVRVPQLRAAPTEAIAGYCVPSYLAQEKYGLVWVALDTPLMDIPHLPESYEPGFRRIEQFYEVWKIGALRLMENSFDLAHISFVHRATFGDMERPEVEYHEFEPTTYGLRSRVVEPVVVRGADAQRAVGTTETETVRNMDSDWFMPFGRRMAIRYPHGLVHVIMTFATPINDTESMVVQWAYRNDHEEDVSAAEVVAFDRAVTLEDKLILESCDPDVPLATIDGEEKHMASDRPGLMMRRMLRDLLQKNGENEQRAHTA